jgi:hypothetical protein
MVLGAGLVYFAPSIAGKLYLGPLLEQASNKGLRVEVEQPSFFWLGVRSPALHSSLISRSLFLQLEFTDFKAGVSPVLSVLSNPQFRIQSGLFGGNLKASGMFSANKEAAITLQLTGSRIEAAKQPQLSAFGVNRGLINLNLADVLFTEHGLTSGKGSVWLEDLAKSYDSRIPLGHGRTLTIPAFTSLNAEFKVGVSAIRQDLERFELDSSLGRLSAGGFSEVAPKGGLGVVSLQGILQPAPQALDWVRRTLLDLTGQELPASSSSTFQFEISGAPEHCVLKVTGL